MSSLTGVCQYLAAPLVGRARTFSIIVFNEEHCVGIGRTFLFSEGLCWDFHQPLSSFIVPSSIIPLTTLWMSNDQGDHSFHHYLYHYLISLTLRRFSIIMAVFLCGSGEGEHECEWDAGRRLASWAALCFLWGMGVVELSMLLEMLRRR